MCFFVALWFNDQTIEIVDLNIKNIIKSHCNYIGRDSLFLSGFVIKCKFETAPRVPHFVHALDIFRTF